jgi:hypothetical protein
VVALLLALVVPDVDAVEDSEVVAVDDMLVVALEERVVVAVDVPVVDCEFDCELVAVVVAVDETVDDCELDSVVVADVETELVAVEVTVVTSHLWKLPRANSSSASFNVLASSSHVSLEKM